MLVNLDIRDFALIDRLRLDLVPGLNVFTGETGAGKSLIVQAFTLLLGERASADVVRAGSERAGVEARFDPGQAPGLAAVLEEAGLPADDGEGLLLVGREIGRKARDNRCTVNGRMATVTLLRDVGAGLVDLHGQHDHQRLLRSSEHLAVLDEVAGDSVLELRRRVEADVAELRRLERRRTELGSGERERQREIDALRFQLDEIDEAELREDELGELEARHRVLANADRVLRLLSGVEELLGGDEGALERLRSLWRDLDELVSYDEGARGLRENFHEAVYLLDEVAAEAERSRESVDCDGEALAAVEERLAVIERLTRKYGPTVADVLAVRAEAAARLEELTSGESSQEALLAALAVVRGRLARSLPDLSRMRAEAARRLEESVTLQLRELGMEAASFAVRLGREASGPAAPGDAVTLGGETWRLWSDGTDRAEFLIAGNAGEAAGPLAKIASGGEISRVMLGIKAALASRDRVPIMVFDEIDVGIGGETAWKVADKLREVSRHCQCICVTHLPQIAAGADGHFQVAKRREGDRTVIGVRPLTQEERVDELARMLGGRGAAARSHAQELLARAARGSGAP